MVGFYVLALTISAVLLAIPVLEYRYLNRVHAQVAIGCVGAAGAVLWALVPRRDRFVPPGPRLHRTNYPAFFAMVDEVARATAQPAPAEIYAVNDVNAFVTHRGGVMGVGSRRVMGIGLPLVQHITAAQLKAVVGHEFGHYDSGDVALGPWIYKTRAVIGRTIAGVSTRDWLARPFEWYGQLFLRVTHAVSRQQEFVADAIGARVAGRSAMSSALERVARLAPAYASYLDQHIEPALGAGRLPPVLDGFRRFVGGSAMRAWMSAATDAEATFGDTNAYDTHPSLSDRLAALAALPAGPVDADAAPAAALLPDADRLAQQILQHVVREATGTSVAALSWDDAGRLVVIPAWRRTVEQCRPMVALPMAEALPSGSAAWLALRRPGQDDGLDEVPEPTVLDWLAWVATAALGLCLSERGWAVHSEPGEPVRLVKGERTVEPHAIVGDLSRGEMTREAWVAMCRDLELTGVPLLPPLLK